MKNLLKKLIKKKYIGPESEDSNVLSHYQILNLIHNDFTPKTYVEIGVQQGRSINLANKKTAVVGIDPFKDDTLGFNRNVKMFHLESDKFFEQHDICKELGNRKIDVSLIDGMHLFEYVLRDFINVEKNCHKDSMILLHDTIPIDKVSSDRTICNGVWTGDVYKIVSILKKYRPDLKIYNVSIPPIGVCLVHNVDPESRVLLENYDSIFEEFVNMTYDDIKDDVDGHLGVLRWTLDDVRKHLSELYLLDPARK